MDKLYTIQEVAAKLNLSDKTLRRWEEAGKFTSSRTLGNQRRYCLEDLQILDAIKHGTINEQKDLLTIEQAGKICGVSPTTIIRWENDGKIHPFITSGNTYYPRQKLVEKMEELKKVYAEPSLEPDPVAKGSDLKERPEPAESKAGRSDPQIDHEPVPQGTVLKRNPWLQAKEGSLASERTVPNGIVQQIITNAAITLILILSYHLIFNQSSVPVSPQAGSVQGATTSMTPDPRLDDLITKFQDHLASEILKDSRPITTSTTKLDNVTLISGSATIVKNTNQISVPADKVTSTTPITVSFTTDFAPAKKYWVTAGDGAFTVSTDFPVSMSSTFNYSFIVPTATTSATLR